MRNVLRWLLAVLLLPVNFIVITPLLLFEFESSRSSDLEKGLSLLLCALGLTLSIRAVRLFAKKGRGGTPAPWDPINQLIISGPYRYVKNPMLIGVIILLFSESVFFASVPLFIYTCLFAVTNAFYFRFSEEPTLIKRYGDEYRRYLENVPRWLPRRTPYDLDRERG